MFSRHKRGQGEGFSKWRNRKPRFGALMFNNFSSIFLPSGVKLNTLTSVWFCVGAAVHQCARSCRIKALVVPTFCIWRTHSMVFSKAPRKVNSKPISSKMKALHCFFSEGYFHAQFSLFTPSAFICSAIPKRLHSFSFCNGECTGSFSIYAEML